MFWIWKKVAEGSKKKEKKKMIYSSVNFPLQSHNINCRVATLCLSWLVDGITIKNNSRDFTVFVVCMDLSVKIRHI